MSNKKFNCKTNTGPSFQAQDQRQTKTNNVNLHSQQRESAPAPGGDTRRHDPEISAYCEYVRKTQREIKMFPEKERPPPEECPEEEEEDFGPEDKARRRIPRRPRPSIYDPESDPDFDPDESDGELFGEMWIPPERNDNESKKYNHRLGHLRKREDFLAFSNLSKDFGKVLKALKDEPLPRPEKPFKYVLDFFGHKVPSKQRNEKISEEVKILQEKVNAVQSEVDRKQKLLNNLSNPEK